MPYAPGNSNNSGQIFAQGLLGAAQTLSSSFLQAEQKKEQDKVWEAQSKATEGLLKSYLPKDQADSILAVNPKETPEARHARLSGTIENFVIGNKLQEQQRAQQQQEKDQKALSAAISQFMPQGIGQQLQGGSTFANLRDPNAQQKFDPTRFMSTYFQGGGSPKSLDQVDQALKMFMPPRTGAAVVEPSSYEDTDPNTGLPIKVTVDKLTGRKLGSGAIQAPKMILTPDEQVDVAGRTEGAKKDAENASIFVNSVPEAADVAQANMPRLQTMEKLLSSGASTGYGQKFLNDANAIGLRLGMVKPGQQADQEQLQKLFAEHALLGSREMYKGQGATSDYERKLIESANADIGKSPEANLRIIRNSIALSQRTMELEQQRQQLVDEGKTTPQIAETLRRFRSKHPLSEYIEKITQDSTIPTGVDAGVWAVMTPEEKALWQKK